MVLLFVENDDENDCYYDDDATATAAEADDELMMMKRSYLCHFKFILCLLASYLLALVLSTLFALIHLSPIPAARGSHSLTSASHHLYKACS